MRRLLPWTAALVLPCLLSAQQGAAGQGDAQAVYDELSAELQKQNTAYREARKAVMATDAYKQARKDRDNAALSKLLNGIERPDMVGLGKKALAAAARFDGDGRVKLLGWAATNSRDKDIITEVVAQLREHHMQSPALSELLENAMVIARPLGNDEAAAFLDEVIAESPHSLPRAWAMYWKATMMSRGRGVSAEQQVAAQKMLYDAEKLAEGHWLADKIRGPRFKEERLQIGMVAPEIEGEDIDGVPFKLSDYRGKVVVLDFWGFW